MAFINKLRYFKIGQEAPKNSCFKGPVNAQSIFGTSNSYFNYTNRYCKKESGSLMDYTGRYGGIDENYTMSSAGVLDTEDKIKEFKDFGLKHLNNGNICYELILSLDSLDTAHKYNLDSQKDFAPLVDKLMPEYLKSLKFNPNNITWWEDFHPVNRTSSTPHPHVHILFFENIPSGVHDRTYGKLPKKSVTEFKRLFAREMIKRETSSKYDEIFNNINVNRAEVIRKAKATNFRKIDSINKLYAVLPESGRLQYNSAHMIQYRESIMRCVDDLLDDNDIRDEWNYYLDSLYEYDELIDNQALSETSTRSLHEIEKIKTELANTILRYKKIYKEQTEYGEVLKNINYKKSDNIKSSQYKDKNIIRIKLSHREQNAIKGLKKEIKKIINQREREIEEEISRYLQGYDKVM